jgi:hypothetical protein
VHAGFYSNLISKIYSSYSIKYKVNNKNEVNLIIIIIIIICSKKSTPWIEVARTGVTTMDTSAHLSIEENKRNQLLAEQQPRHHEQLRQLGSASIMVGAKRET